MLNFPTNNMDATGYYVANQAQYNPPQYHNFYEAILAGNTFANQVFNSFPANYTSYNSPFNVVPGLYNPYHSTLPGDYYQPTISTPPVISNNPVFGNMNPPISGNNSTQGFYTVLQTLSGLFNSFLGNMGNQPIPNTQPAPTPPPPPPSKIKGSVNISGNAQLSLGASPYLGNVPNQLKTLASGLANKQVVNLFSDPDKGGFEVHAAAYQLNPNNTSSIGLYAIGIKAGSDIVCINNNGEVTVNGEVKNYTGSPITLPGGAVLTSENINNRQQMIIKNGEYKVAIALNKLPGNTYNNLDLTVEELTLDAADNATGYQVNVTGSSKKYGVADLLKLEPTTSAF